MIRNIKRTLLILTCTVLMLPAEGCEDKKDVTVDQAADYLTKIYGKEFKLSERCRLPGCHPNEYRKYYLFKDPDGIECHVFFDVEHSTDGWHYDVTEDYQVKYLENHPEIYSSLAEGNRDVKLESRDFSFHSMAKLVVHYSDYDDISSAVNFASDKLSSVSRIYDPSPDPIILEGPISIKSETVKVVFRPYGADDGENFNEPYLEMPLSFGISNNKDNVISSLQSGITYYPSDNGTAETTEPPFIAAEEEKYDTYEVPVVPQEEVQATEAPAEYQDDYYGEHYYIDGNYGDEYYMDSYYGNDYYIDGYYEDTYQ